MEIRDGGLDDPQVVALLNVHFQGMLANSPKDSCHFLDLSGLRAPGVTFWSAWDGEDLLGCGALKQLDPQHGEIKSMRTAAEHLRRGTGAALVSHILGVARARGYKRLSLETGSGEAFDAAHALYRQFGFTECAPFADYKEDPFSRFLSRVL
ncbi:GNAT family N-acetyltransferase [Sphingomonas psychrotolerans]|uniref:GNAT family N-acetyltransferase n=1 Tax=Sphingomonas psychrotolerans TaxID=1327635 RepID=A0A2K8MIP8_9SPHN|nr:GNAT family N-acetyltransferase [Sphingomonas psychrotolerans]ATY33750.1 GNAT family N-acetyltransferase [Sphingomonas psychrotolerans]